MDRSRYWRAMADAIPSGVIWFQVREVWVFIGLEVPRQV